MQSTGLAVVWGAPKCGKSFWTFDVLMHVALGGSIVAGVSGRERSCIAPSKARKASGTASKPSDRPRCRRPTAATHPSISWRRRSAWSESKGIHRRYQQATPQAEPVAVCIDTLNRSLDGSESSDEDMDGLRSRSRRHP